MIWPLEFSVPNRGRTCPVVSAWNDMIRTIICQRLQLASFLAFGASLKLQIQGHSRIEDVRTLQLTALRHKTIAMESLARHLKSHAPDSSVLFAALHLMCLEMYSIELDMARMHLRALKNILDGMSTTSAIPNLHYEYFLIVSSYSAMVMRENPPVDMQEWDPGPIRTRSETVRWSHVSLKEEVSEALHPPVGGWLDVHYFCGDVLGGLIEDLRELFAVKAIRDVKLRDGRQHDDVHRWGRLRSVGCVLRLHHLRTSEVESLARVFEVLNISTTGQSDGPMCEQQQQQQQQQQHDHHNLRPSAPLSSATCYRRLRQACVCIGASFCEVLSSYRAREQMDQWGHFADWENSLLTMLDRLLLMESCSTNDEERLRTKEEEGEDDEYHEEVKKDNEGPGRGNESSLILVFWSAVMGAMAHRMQRTWSSAKLEHFHFIIRRLMDVLDIQTCAEVSQTCKRVLWCEAVMGPILKELMYGSDM